MNGIILWFLLLSTSFVHAEVLFEDPTGDDLNEAVGEILKEKIKDISGYEKREKEYFLGLVYLKGSKNFNIEKNCGKAKSLLQSAWENGVTDAGYTLAVMHYHGACTKRNIKESRKLAAETAKEGYILSQRMLGRAYLGREWGELYPKNIKKAIYWLKKAGESGDSQSASKLSYIYREGIGTEKDKRKSFTWIKKAAFSKFEPAETIYFPSLAEYYEKGIGTDVDLVKAYKYYDLSGTAGAEGKQRVAKKMTKAQIDEATRQSQAWQEKHNVQVGGGFIRRVK